MKSTLNNTIGRSQVHISFILSGTCLLVIYDWKIILHQKIEAFQKIGFVNTIDFYAWIYFRWEWKNIIYIYEVLGKKPKQNKPPLPKRQSHQNSKAVFALSVCATGVMSTVIYSGFSGIMCLLWLCWQQYYNNITMLLFNCFLV